MTLHSVENVIIPTDELISFRGVETTNQMMLYIVLDFCRFFRKKNFVGFVSTHFEGLCFFPLRWRKNMCPVLGYHLFNKPLAQLITVMYIIYTHNIKKIYIHNVYIVYII